MLKTYLTLGLLVFLLALGISQATTDTGSVYKIESYIGAGGLVESSVNFNLTSGVGQLVIDNETTTNFSMQQGIYYYTGANLTVPFEVVVQLGKCSKFMVRNVSTGTILFSVDCNGHSEIEGNLTIGANTTMEELTVNKNVIIKENLTVLGNITGNFIYGEMWNRSPSATPWTFTVAAAGIYYNFTGLIDGDLNGMSTTHDTQANGGSCFNIEVAGIYKVDATVSWITSTAGGTYGFGVTHNFDVNKHRECYARRQATNTVGNVGITCIIDAGIGDKINIQVEDESAPARDLSIHNVNINIMRIGD